MGGELKLVMATEEGRDLMHHFRRGIGAPFASPPVESGHNSLPGDLQWPGEAETVLMVRAAGV